MSCSMPKTTTFAALRPAVVVGTFAQDWANGAAAGVPPDAGELPELVAVADAAKRSTAAAAPARSQRRLCIDFPPFVRRREPVHLRRRLLAPTPRRASRHVVRRRRGSLVRNGPDGQGRLRRR